MAAFVNFLEFVSSSSDGHRMHRHVGRASHQFSTQILRQHKLKKPYLVDELVPFFFRLKINLFSFKHSVCSPW